MIFYFFVASVAIIHRMSKAKSTIEDPVCANCKDSTKDGFINKYNSYHYCRKCINITEDKREGDQMIKERGIGKFENKRESEMNQLTSVRIENENLKREVNKLNYFINNAHRNILDIDCFKFTLRDKKKTSADLEVILGQIKMIAPHRTKRIIYDETHFIDQGQLFREEIFIEAEKDEYIKEGHYGRRYKYKLRLYTYINNEEKYGEEEGSGEEDTEEEDSTKLFGLYCNIMMGDDDNKLKWPLRRTVILCFINLKAENQTVNNNSGGSRAAYNQNNENQTNIVYFYELKASFNKPNTDEGQRIYPRDVVTYQELRYNGVIDDGTIGVRCVIINQDLLLRNIILKEAAEDKERGIGKLENKRERETNQLSDLISENDNLKKEVNNLNYFINNAHRNILDIDCPNFNLRNREKTSVNLEEALEEIKMIAPDRAKRIIYDKPHFIDQEQLYSEEIFIEAEKDEYIKEGHYGKTRKYTYKLRIHTSNTREGEEETHYVELYCEVMVGDDDDKLKWPLKRTVILCFINQSAEKCVYFYELKTSFNRPGTDRCESIGTGERVEYEDLCIDDVIVDDIIAVRCVIINQDLLLKSLIFNN